ncbi:MAG: hypothetical protein Q7R76_02570 [Candidatus Woesearchaeota archaeon]|nr:hypothetical protein [Candidatus Woesearchaeota archaeon]
MAINPLYFKEENIRKIQQMFASNQTVPSIVLHDFFQKECYEQLKQGITRAAFQKERHPILYSYQEATPSFVNEGLNTKEMLDFLQKILNKKIKKITGTVQCFGWKDYTILNDEVVEKPGIDLFFCLSDDWDESYGGNVVYVDGTGEYTKTLLTENMLMIVERKKGVQKFVQYVNHRAQNKKLYLMRATINA